MGLLPDEWVRDPDQPVCIVHHVDVLPDEVEAYKRYVLETYLEPANRERGCRLYDLWQDNAEPTHFVVVEIWDDKARLEEHMQRPYVIPGLAGARALQAGEMRSHYLQSVYLGAHPPEPER